MVNTASLYRSVLLVLLLARLQIDTPRVAVERDLNDLYLRVSASRAVVVGTVSKAKGVTKRMTPELREKVKISWDAASGGFLYDFTVEDTICRQEDFRVSAALPARLPPATSTLAPLFIPFEEPFLVMGRQREILGEGRRYLLLLSEPDTKKQREWTESFQLDRDRIYYRATERSRGVVLLDPPERPNAPDGSLVLEKVTRLCSAVRPPTLEGKLLELKKLAESGDPVLQREAEIAATALRAQVKPPRQ